MNNPKFLGIDERVIKCSCGEDSCRQVGISFDENYLRVHFLQQIEVNEKLMLSQKTVAMQMDKASVKELIAELKQFSKSLK